MSTLVAVQVSITWTSLADVACCPGTDECICGAVAAACKLLPCETGSWEEDEVGGEGPEDDGRWAIILLEMDEAFYEQHPDGFSASDADGNITIEWETP